MQILLDKNKKFYKANLHCHSTYSDGKLTVEELKRRFMERGYSIVAFTDHEHVVDNSRLTDENFLAITACELAIKEFPKESATKNMNMRVCHLNFYALDPHNNVTPCYSSVYDHFGNPEALKDLIHYDGEYERVYSAEGINEMIQMGKDAGFIVSYNHPRWSLESAADYLNYDGMFAVEIYNHAVVTEGGTDYFPQAFEDLLRAGKKVFCTMTDDCHAHDRGIPDADMFGGFVMINAEKLEYDEIMNCLQKGDFYASNGPEILSLVRDGNKVIVETSEAMQIAYTTRGRRAHAVNATADAPVCRAEFEVREADEYFRISVTDFSGRHAHTQAYEV
ncbi:MAG: hypothetical protein IJ333_03355 [Clostridia bacterium]|nr:hypothetical protein [Clostridia bacterium]